MWNLQQISFLLEKKTYCFSSKDQDQDKDQLPHLLFNTVLDILVIAKQEKEIKGIHIEKEEVKLVLLAHGMLYTLKKIFKSISQKSYWN